MSEPAKPTSVASAVQTILVVDDEVLVRLVIAEYLRDCGYRVHEAASAEEAVIVLDTPDTAIDLVFSDVVLPGTMDGFGLAQWIRANHPHVQVVLTSGVARSAKLAASLCESGPMMRKPYEPQHVVDRIRQLLAAVDRTSGAGEPKALLNVLELEQVDRCSA